jgi:Fur family ferric uptake transcriptional regulator
VTEVEPTIAAGLVGDVAARFGFRTDLRHLTVFGICRECS